MRRRTKMNQQQAQGRDVEALAKRAAQTTEAVAA